MPPRPKTAKAKLTATTRTKPNAGVGHVLGPVTVAAPKSAATSNRRKADYVEISSSSSDGEPEPATKAARLEKTSSASVAPLKKSERAKRQPSAAPAPSSSSALPAPATLLPPPIPAVPTPAATTAPVTSTAKRPRSPTGRTLFSTTYPHEARVSRFQVEQEWTLVPSPGRRSLRDQVEQTARETVKDWSRKQPSTASRSEPALSAKQLKSLQAALAEFANDFDQLLTGVPISPLSGPLLTLDPNKTTTSRKKARLRGETDADERDWVWSLEALEAKC